jgi:hypothetical protein
MVTGARIDAPPGGNDTDPGSRIINHIRDAGCTAARITVPVLPPLARRLSGVGKVPSLSSFSLMASVFF